MTNDAFQKTYEDQLLSLPDINRAAIQSHDWMTEVITVGKKHGLHIDQIDDLRIEVMLVLVGALPAQEFQNTIMAELAVSPAEAAKITKDVNNAIFDPIHTFIVNGEQVKTETPRVSTPQAKPATEPIHPPEPAMENTLQKIGITVANDPIPETIRRTTESVSPGIMGRAGVMPEAMGLQKPQSAPRMAALKTDMEKTLNPKPIVAEKDLSISSQLKSQLANRDQTKKTLESFLNAKPKEITQQQNTAVAVSALGLKKPETGSLSITAPKKAPAEPAEDKRTAALKKLDAMLGGSS